MRLRPPHERSSLSSHALAGSSRNEPGPRSHHARQRPDPVGEAGRPTPAVAISLSMRAGSIADPRGMAGMTWLLSRVIDRGTATRSAAGIAGELDGRGITLTVIVPATSFDRLPLPCRGFRAVLALLATSSCRHPCRRRRSRSGRVR
jgi:hypothetical protein